MKTFARFASIALLATCAFTSGSIAQGLSTLSVTDGQDRSANGPFKAPIPTCTPGDGCTFPVGNSGK